MKLNSHVIFLIAIVGIITAGVVGATILNNGSMKQTDFDGIKVSVPSDSNFVKTADGYADSKYGITIHTFKNNDSVVNFLKGKSGASVISLKNQPPQSVAFVQGDDTNVLVTNGGEAIAIGAKDQGLVSDMSNTVVFSNHQKSAKPNPVVPVILPPPHLEFHRDFYLIMPLLAKINTKEFNVAIFESNINNTINDYNVAADNNQLSEYTANEFAQNMPSDNGVNNNQQNTSLLDNQNVSNVVSSIGSDNPSNSAGGDSGASANSGDVNSPAPSIAPDANANSNPTSSSSSSSGSGSSSSSGSSASSSSGSHSSSGNAPADNSNQKQKITSSDAKNVALAKYPGAKVSNVNLNGDVYIVSLKDSSGTHKVKVDAYTGKVL